MTALNPAAVTVLRMLTTAADAGLKCPSNSDILVAVGLSSPGAGPRILKRLEEEGFIRVESGQCARVVTILSSGRKTAGSPGTLHWRFRPENKHRLKRNYSPVKVKKAAGPEPEPDLTPVNRDPCPRCGVRADHGCSHSRRAAETVWIRPLSTLGDMPRSGA